MLTTGPVGERSVHLNFTGIWDEVELTYRWSSAAGHRQNRSAMRGPALVQKGIMTFALADHGRGDSAIFQDSWLTPPLEVAGASAACLLPAIERGHPTQLVVDNLDALRSTVGRVSALTLMPICDGASSNLVILRHMGHQVENILCPEVGHTLLIWPDTCGVHLHHRAKLALKDLRKHTMRHYAIAKLFRLKGERNKMIRKLEDIVAQSVVRIIGPPPENIEYNLELLIDILYDWGAHHHKRKGSQFSQLYQDLKSLAAMVNGDVTSGAWQRFCWDKAKQGPCCDSEEETIERTTVACVNAFFAAGDPVPAESRWTHMLPNMKKILLRRLVYRSGLDCFCGPVDDEALGGHRTAAEVDGEAMAEYLAVVNKVRRARAAEYFAEEANMRELAVLTVVTEATDSLLLYPMFGDPGRAADTGNSKMDMLLDKEQSLVGKCMQKLLDLLDSWQVGGSSREPWALLGALGAPTMDEAFARWSRSQVLRMCSALYRRFEVRLSAWPYRLYALANDSFTEDEKIATARSLLQEDVVMLDVYSRGIRAMFPSVEQLLSRPCGTVLSTDFKVHPFGTDSVERLNAELARGHPSRGPARNFSHMAREREHASPDSCRPPSPQRHRAFSPPSRGPTRADRNGDVPPALATASEPRCGQCRSSAQSGGPVGSRKTRGCRFGGGCPTSARTWSRRIGAPKQLH